MKYANENAKVHGWGSDKNARRVTFLTKEEREAIRAGDDVRIAGCPAYQGQTERRVVAIGRGFYTRMPA